MKKNSFFRDLLEVIIAVAVISFILLKFIVMPCQVNGKSMFPTLKEGYRTYSFIISRNIGINRFDICVVDTKTEDNEKLLVKRIIGMPNETIEYKNNVLYIDGVETDEDFLGDDVYTDDFVVTLKEDEYFCMGDNREVSKDSRFYGPFKKNAILATKMFVLYPFSEIGFK